MGLLKESSRKYNQTILMVTHNEALAQACDRIIRIEDGKLYRSGGGDATGTEKTAEAPQGRAVTVYEKRMETCPCLYETL